MELRLCRVGGVAVSSILRPLERWADREPDTTLYAFLDKSGQTTQSYTYEQFVQRTIDIAAHIRRAHLFEPGDRVLLAYPPGLEIICAFFACVRLGLIPVPVYPPVTAAGLHKMNYVARDCAAKAVLTERSCRWAMRWNSARKRIVAKSLKRDAAAKLKWITSDDAERNSQCTLPQVYSDVLFLQYTSGSTQSPKGVIVTHENIQHNCDIVVDHRPVGVSWLPQYHDMGLIGYYLFFALRGGTTYGFSPLDFIQRPVLWLETISRYRGTASSAPNFAYEYCLRPGKLTQQDFDGLDLSSLRFLMTAAEPVRAGTYRAFLERFQPFGLDPKSFFAAYGLAEYTLAVSNYGRNVCTFDADALAENRVVRKPGANAAALVSCGAPLSDTDVKIVDTSGRPRELRDGGVGEIWIAGLSKCRGYWGRPQLSRDTFEAELPCDASERTWLRSGDLGFMHGGQLYICGREKDLIIIRGRNYYPQDVEAVVEDEPTVRKGCVAAFTCEAGESEALVVIAELKDSKLAPDAHELSRKLHRRLDIRASTVAFMRPHTIPKTSSGKLARHLVRQRWLEGSLNVVRSVNLNDVAATASHDVVGALFGRHGLTGAERVMPWEAGLDSIALLELTHDVKTHVETLGHDDLSKVVDIRLLQKMEIAEVFDLLCGLTHGRTAARQRFKRAFAASARVEQAMMRADASLRFVPKLPAGTANGPRDVLLTGGTGFFGPFLLKSLLEQTRSDIYVLVRARDPEAAMERLRHGLSALDVSHSLQLPGERRVLPVCGDLARPHFGLSRLQWDCLADNVATIYHNGALVNYLFDYAAMRDVNVGGTNEVIRLAFSRRAKVLNHISTTFVFGWSVKHTLLESDTNQNLDLLDFGYSQTKWASEQVVLDAMRHGLSARIFRPALITPSVTGGGCDFDISIRLLAFMLKHGIGTTAENQVSFSTADIAADNIVAISNAPESIGCTYHVTRDTYANMGHIMSILGDLTQREFTNLALSEFVPQVIERCGKDDLLFPLLDFLVRSVKNITAMEFKRYDNSNYQRVRDRVPGARQDPPLEDVVLGMLRFMRRYGIVET